jgi:hypothetical protein
MGFTENLARHEELMAEAGYCRSTSWVDTGALTDVKAFNDVSKILILMSIS